MKKKASEAIKVRKTFNQPLIREWLKRLRSGDYKPGRDRLKNTTDRVGLPLKVPTYCCLGVLQDIIDPSWKGIRPTQPVIHGFTWKKEVGPTCAVGGSDYDGGVQDILAEINDEPVKPTYTRVIKWIEKNLLDKPLKKKKVTKVSGKALKGKPSKKKR